MTPTEHSRFTTLHAQSQLVPAYKPAHVLAALAVRGSRDEPKEKGTGKGIGGLGGFVDWAGEELAEYRVE